MRPSTCPLTGKVVSPAVPSPPTVNQVCRPTRTMRRVALRAACPALIGAAMCLSAAQHAHAAIASVTGAMTPIAPPPSLVIGALESSTAMFIIDEGTSFVPPAPLFVDGFGPGPQFPAGPLAVLPAGLPIHTYIVHFDPVGGGFATVSGSVTFDPGEIIVGLAMHTPYLDATDGFPIGLPAVIYPTGDLDRGFETLPGTDTGFIAFDLNSVSFDLFAELGIDQVRIFTTIPEPASAALLSMGAAATIVRRKQRV